MHIGDEVVFSNATGEFSLRLTKPQRAALTVATDEFLSRLHFTIISAPPTATAASEDSVKDILIVLRPVTNAAR